MQRCEGRQTHWHAQRETSERDGRHAHPGSCHDASGPLDPEEARQLADTLKVAKSGAIRFFRDRIGEMACIVQTPEQQAPR